MRRSIAFIVLALALAGCAQTASAPAASSHGAAGASALKPIDRSALRTVVETAARELLVPGAVVLLRTPQGEVAIPYGTTELGTAKPPRLDTSFRIASNTKTMTAAVIVQLAQEGKLRLDDPVSAYVAGVPNGEQITITQLLEMRSGLYNYTDAPEISQSIDRDPTRAWTPEQLLAIAFAQPPRFAPGARFQYNNTNYVLLGLVAERAGGVPLASAMSDRLFAPLGLRRTLLPASTSNAMPEPSSHGYQYGGASVALVGEPPYSPDVRAAARNGTLRPNDVTNVNHSFATAAGGVVSTAGDLATWIRALVVGRVLDAESQRRWRDSPRPEDPGAPDGQRYGYGIARVAWASNAMYFHGGETVGFNSFMGHDPGSDVTLVVWTNLAVSPVDESPTANTLALKVLDAIYVASPLAPR